MYLNMSKRFIIKIPKDIILLYCEKKKLLTFVGPLSKKSLQLKLKILILKPKNHIIITKLSFYKISSNQKKTLKALQNTVIALIKQIILEISFVFSKKLIFIGVGYKVFSVLLFENNHLLHLRLGFSHQIYFKVPKFLNVFCLKTTTIFICGNLFHEINHVSAKIRSHKHPEPYNGKGILFDNEKIFLKEGKKI